jgi:serine/threonine-protein kinase
VEATSTELKPGDVIDDYEIQEVIGRGNMSEIYRARQIKLDRDVAIKILGGKTEYDPDMKELAEQEARVIARLNHPNIISVIDCGVIDNCYYMVMEYLYGTDFQQVLDSNLKTLEENLRVVAEALKGLAYAHNNNVIHRDIKPANILISTDGRVKLADFGIAVVAESSSDANETDGLIVGTPAYMAPEQWLEGASCNSRTDIYSIGVLLYKVLTSQHPNSNPLPPSSINEKAPPLFDNLVLRCLEKDPTQRYQSAAEVRDNLLSYLNDLQPQPSNTSKVFRAGVSKLIGNCAYLETLSQSLHGSAYLVKNRADNSLYVIKKMVKQTQGVREAQMLAVHNHPHILDILGAGTDGENGIIVSEYAPGGSLADRLVQSYSMSEALRLLKQIASALCFAHEHDVLHGNLRPSNILFDNNSNVKVADFALPMHYGKKRKNWYCAPEEQNSPVADIYSVGIMLHQMLTRRLPVIDKHGDPNWIVRSRDHRFTLLNIVSQMSERNQVLRPPSFRSILDQIASFEKYSARKRATESSLQTESLKV